MKIKKKLLSIVLWGVFCLSISLSVNAQDVSKKQSVYVYTKNVPDEVIEYTKNNIGEVLLAAEVGNSCTVGTPFTLEGHSGDLFYFLVYDNDKIVGFYRVYKDENGEYTGIYSEEKVVINNICAIDTTSDMPMQFVVGDYEDIYAIVNNKVKTILPDYEGRTTEIITNRQTNTRTKGCSTIDASERIDIANPVVPRATTSKYLNISRSETQGDNKWCAAYVTAGICRYMTGRSNIYAKTIMKWRYPNLSDDDLKGKSLSRAKAVEYANTLGLSPTNSSSRLSWSRIVSEINADRPLYFGCDIVGTDKAHAVLCRGYYKATKSYYSIWNPHGTSYEVLNASTYIYKSTGGTEYKYARTIYSWD